MLLFKPEHIPMILGRTKTETRRLWKKPRVTVNSLQKAKVYMLSKKYFAVLRIKYIFQQHLLEITEEEARREGYPSKESYFWAWDRINPDSQHQTNPLLWVVGFTAETQADAEAVAKEAALLAKE